MYLIEIKGAFFLQLREALRAIATTLISLGRAARPIAIRIGRSGSCSYRQQSYSGRASLSLGDDQRIERSGAVSLGVDHQRVDIDLDNARRGPHQARDREDGVRHRLDVDSWRAAESGEQLRRAQLVQRLDDLRFVGVDRQELHVPQLL